MQHQSDSLTVKKPDKKVNILQNQILSVNTVQTRVKYNSGAREN